MSNWSLPAGTRHETLGITSADGVTVTAGSGSKGSYATIGTTGFAYSGFTVMLGKASAGDRFRFDVAVNTGGSDQVIVADFYCDTTLNGTSQTLRWFFPVRIPAGAVVKVRQQNASGAITTTYAIIGIAQDFPGMPPFSRCIAATDFSGNNPANSVTQTGTTPTGYTTIQATTTARITGLYVTFSNMASFSRTAANFVVDIAVGAAASEVILFSTLGFQSSFAIENTGGFYVPCDIPAGKRIAFRVTASNAATGIIGVACMGLAA